MKCKKTLALVAAFALVLAVGFITVFATASTAESGGQPAGDLPTVADTGSTSEQAGMSDVDEHSDDAHAQDSNEAVTKGTKKGTETIKDANPVVKDANANISNDTNIASNENMGTPAAEEHHESGVTVSNETIMEEGVQGTAETVNDIEIVDTSALRSFLDSLDYHPYTNDGLPEYDISFDDGTTYSVNLTSRWVWQDNEKEATLSEALLAELQSLLGIR